ncbi:olfactory receptor 2K2-like [Pleurodeles waltl]|uniref:olfactory receptor 2K2-like n=1 Tax=Pleurodeles waltl TaxID=8319 RepID=UPI0037095AA0
MPLRKRVLLKNKKWALALLDCAAEVTIVFRSLLEHLEVKATEDFIQLETAGMRVSTPDKVMLQLEGDIERIIDAIFWDRVKRKVDLMESVNETRVTEFILLGFSYQSETKITLFVLLITVFLVSVSANSLFILVTVADSCLHSPMYFFLCHLSSLDLFYSLVIAPTVLEGLLVHRITILYSRCVIQMYVTLSLGAAECFLLAVMAWDRYVAICSPLHYPQMINSRTCIMFTTATWAGGFLISLPSVVFLPMIHFCGHNVIDHTVCELQAVSRLTCLGTSYSDLSTPLLSLLSLVAPLVLILFTYMKIISTILRMRTAEGRQRTFTTCGSHLIIVILYYSTAMVIYLRPKSSPSTEKDKSLSLFYGLVVPALNPLIYTLRNKEVKEAVKRLYNKGTSCRIYKA